MQNEVQKSRRQRSPAYPKISLDSALEKTRVLFNAEYRHPMAMEVASSHWKIKSTSGNFGSYISALLKFGLVDEIKDTNGGRQVKVSDEAFKFLSDEREDPTERNNIIQNFALNPTLYNELWDKYGGDLPTDNNLKHHLLTVLEFNPKVVDSVISNFRKTIEFADLSNDKDNIGSFDKEEKGLKDHQIHLGDYVQWFSGEVAQFPEPKKVINIQENYAFVEGTNTGIPLAQLKKLNKPIQSQTQPSVPMQHSPVPDLENGFKEEVSDLAEGPAKLQWPEPISKESVEDLEDWLKLVIRKLHRRASKSVGREKPDD